MGWRERSRKKLQAYIGGGYSYNATIDQRKYFGATNSEEAPRFFAKDQTGAAPPPRGWLSWLEANQERRHGESEAKKS